MENDFWLIFAALPHAKWELGPIKFMFVGTCHVRKPNMMSKGVN